MVYKVILSSILVTTKKEEEEEDVNMTVSYSIYVNQSLSEENEFSFPSGRK